MVHVGAHEAEELAQYEELDWGSERVIWVEALPDKAQLLRETLRELPNHSVIEALVWSASGERIAFVETTNSQSSSALPLGEHLRLYPEIRDARKHDLLSSRLEDLLDFSDQRTIGLLNLDIQGAELRALEGLGGSISKVEAIYCEVNLVEIYQGNPLLSELDDFLTHRGFVLADAELLPDGWGDALWLKKERLPRFPSVRRSMRQLDQRFSNIARDLWQRIIPV